MLTFLIALSCAGFPVATAEQYWIAWEGDDFPENEGWTRYTRAGGAERSLEDGTLILDGTASTEIVDIYYIQTGVVPDPGEQFLLDWRLRVDQVEGFADPVRFSCATAKRLSTAWARASGSSLRPACFTSTRSRRPT